MTEPLDIIGIEAAWEDYIKSWRSDAGQHNLLAWMGERVGQMLQEIRILRTQVEGLQATLAKEEETSRDTQWDVMGEHKEWLTN